MTEKQYPELPDPTAWRSYDNLLKRARYDAVPITSTQPGIYSHTRMFTEDQTRAFADATCAMRAEQAAPAAGAVAGSDDLSGTLRRLDSKELAAWVDRGMALSENLAMYVQAGCTLRESQARDMLRAHLFSAQPAPAAPTSPAKGQITKLRNAAKKEQNHAE